MNNGSQKPFLQNAVWGSNRVLFLVDHLISDLFLRAHLKNVLFVAFFFKAMKKFRGKWGQKRERVSLFKIMALLKIGLYYFSRSSHNKRRKALLLSRAIFLVMLIFSSQGQASLWYSPLLCILHGIVTVSPTVTFMVFPPGFKKTGGVREGLK